MWRQILAADDKQYGGKDEDDAQCEARREVLAKAQNTYGYCGHRLQRTHDGSRGRTDVVHSHHHQYKREHRWQQRKLCGVKPLARSVNQLYRLAHGKGVAQYSTQAEHQSVERQLDRRHTQRRLVDNDYIHSICQRRNHHERHTQRAERGSSLSMVEQGDTAERQHYGEDSGCRHLLLEQGSHDYSHHYGIDKQQCRRDAHIHVVETDV